MFESHPAVERIVLAASHDELIEVRAATVRFSKVTDVVAGGETRARSVEQGLAALPGEIAVVLVHDAARPLLTHAVIDRVLDGVARVGAAVPGLPVADTVKRVDASSIARSTLPRSVELDGRALTAMVAVQTPQGARADLLREAYRRFDFAAGEPTDEATLVEAMGAPVEVVAGDAANLKITRPEDLDFALRLLGASAPPETAIDRPSTAFEFRTGFGYDVHAFAEPESHRKLFLGGVEIPHDRGLDGHSDADVLLHAVCDALLGAASLGDIGILFPNTDPAYRGISSLRLLEVVGERVRDAGWTIVNVDAAAVAEAPKIMPHRARMMAVMANSLGISEDRVSVKATTNEQMGFVGRREGIACWAVATLSRGQPK